MAICLQHLAQVVVAASAALAVTVPIVLAAPRFEVCTSEVPIAVCIGLLWVLTPDIRCNPFPIPPDH